jgi:hypothetical protein
MYDRVHVLAKLHQFIRSVDLYPPRRRELELKGVREDATWPIHRLASVSKLLLGTESKSLPRSLWQMPSLRALELRSHYGFRGRIPDIPPTAKLQSLAIDMEPLTSLPDTIGRLSDLTSLTIKKAKLGQLPASLTQLSSLRVLELVNMRVDVHLRDGLTALERINIEDCDGTNDLGPLARFPNLQSLHIGEVASSSLQFGAHSMLTSLHIEFSPGLTKLPASVGNLSQLRELKLVHLKGLEHFPDEASRLTALTALTIIGCINLDMTNLYSLPSLRTLNIFCDDHLPPTVAPLSNLEELGLYWNDADTALPSGITALTRLTSFTFMMYGFNQHARDIDIPALSQLPRLRRVSCDFGADANAPRLVDRMLTNATGITSLEILAQHLQLWSPCNYTPPTLESIPAIATLTNLRRLRTPAGHVDWPASVASLSKLTRLTLDIFGDMPDDVFSLTNLRHIEICAGGSRWLDAGRLPAQVTRLQRLTVLHMPEHMKLCRQVTRLRRLGRVEGISLERGDDEHLRAVQQLQQKNVKVIEKDYPVDW